MAKTSKVVKLDSNEFVHLEPFFTSGTKFKNISDVNTIVIHWTAGNLLIPSIEWLEKQRYGYHFLIDKEGKVIQGQALNIKMSHAGASYGPNGKYANGSSISICIQQLNGKTDIPSPVLTVIPKLIRDINTALNGAIKYVTTHIDISPGRKEDPWRIIPHMDKIITNSDIPGLVYWQTGMNPNMETDLKDCKCDEWVTAKNGLRWCKKTRNPNGCKGPTEKGYSGERSYTYETRETALKILKRDINKTNELTSTPVKGNENSSTKAEANLQHDASTPEGDNQ
jgi:hypothetical protein